MELLAVGDDDELGDVEFFGEQKEEKNQPEKKKKLQTEHVNNFHYPHLEDGMLEDLDSYVKWHKEHPGTTTPRKARGNITNLLGSGTLLVSEANPELVYTQTKAGRTQRTIPEQFKSRDLGKDAEFTVVTSKAHNHEHHLRLKESLEFEDPWWNKSVKDQVFVHHVHDYHEDEGSWEMDSTVVELTQHMTKSSKLQQRDELKRAKAEELALGTAWGKKPRARKTIWEDPTEFSQYTINGTEALDGFTAEALEKNLEIALKEYEAGESDQSHLTGAGLSAAAAELHQRLADYREILGGLEETEKLSEQFVKYSTKIRKQMEGGASVFDGKTGDFLDACIKSNPAKVIPMLMFHADPNTLTEDEEPVFVMTMKKVIFSDASRGSEQEKETKERKNCLKIMEALVQYGANLNCFVTENKITPLMIVASAGHVELVEWLLKNGADPNITCPHTGATALMMAAKYGHPKCIAEIVRKKGKVNAKDGLGNTPLHYSAMFGQTRTAKFLLRIGASRFQRNNEGKKPAEVASQKGYFVTSQIIAGFCPPAEASAPALKYISDRLHVIPKKPTVGDKIKEGFTGLFRAASNLFSSPESSSESWIERITDSFSRLQARIREFDYRDVLAWFRRSKQIHVQPRPAEGESNDLTQLPDNS